MMEQKLDQFFYSIRNDCLELLEKKDISLEQLAAVLGISQEEFVKRFYTRSRDLSFYLKTYSLLVEW